MKQLVFSLSLSLLLCGCAIYNSEYYIPINNQTGDAKPLSKDDVIRVIIPNNYPIILSNMYGKNGGHPTVIILVDSAPIEGSKTTVL
ncbi:hypothetical protein HK18_08675 [Commensalibacter intestini]|uniref:Lipoprotein n=1 Tax=Commensalibacter intestini TaxID=479936 RepID=A0A251ZV95_9PROT|nr:hypothetical protein [Commensalibacter intestini]OUI78562.1 hypothetical protein HK18_08675 [Commensalibacter intestini]